MRGPIVVLFLALASSSSSAGGRNPELESLFDDFFRFKTETHPEAASMAGIHSQDARLSARGTESARALEDKCSGFVDRAEQASGDMDAEDALDRHYLNLLWRDAKACRDNHRHAGFLFPEVNILDHPAQMEDYFTDTDFFRAPADARVALERLRKVPGYVKGIKELLEEGVRRNVTYSKVSLVGVPELVTGVAAKTVEDSGFYSPFRTAGKAMKEAAKRVIEEEIFPAYSELAEYLSKDYSKHLRRSLGVWSLPRGQSFYQACLEFYTSTRGIHPTQVHQVGLDQVQEYKNKVQEFAQEHLAMKSNASVSEIFRHARSIPEQKFKTRDKFLRFVKDILETRINPKLKSLLPKKYLTGDVYELEVKPASWGGSPVFYQAGSPDGKRKGVFYVNAAHFREFSRFEMAAMALHEGNPGHHTQMGAFNVLHDFPEFLTFKTSEIPSTAPSRTYTYTAHAEGWALYAESLGAQTGVYADDSLDLLGYYAGRLLRAARLVVDTGVNAFGWTRNTALAYLLDNTALSRRRAEAEVARCATWPAQGTAYAMGERRIAQARKKREEQERKKFDLKMFHRDVLACLGPMDDDFDKCLEMQKELP